MPSEVRGRLNNVARPSNMKVVSGSGLTQASLVSSWLGGQPSNLTTYKK